MKKLQVGRLIDGSKKPNRSRSGTFPKSFLLSSLLLSLLLFVFSVVAQSASEDGMPPAPQYSILYDQLLGLEEKGDFLEALRLVPKIYATEIPVEIFYTTLENKRQQLLNAVIEQELSFRIGEYETNCSDILRLFTDLYLGQPDVYNFLVPVPGSLEYDRFCYLLIVEGHSQQASDNSLLIPSTSQFNLQSALDSADPWLVSAALFFARKQKTPTITAQAVIDRWQARPDLWDEESTRLALHFLAQLDSKAYGVLQVSNDDIRLALEDLRPVPDGNSYLSPLLFSALGKQFSGIDASTGITLIELRENEEKNGVVKRWAGDDNHYSNLEPVMERKITDVDLEYGAIAVVPGVYQIVFNSVHGAPPSGYYGKSVIVKAQGGNFLVVPVSLLPAI